MTKQEMLEDGRFSARSDKELLDLFDSCDFYIFDLCEEICLRAGLEDEWAATDGENFEEVVDRAYDILKGGVEL